MKKRSKEEKREEKEEKKGRKIPLRNYTKGGRKSSVIAGVNILLFILAVVISILKKGRNLCGPFNVVGYGVSYSRICYWN